MSPAIVSRRGYETARRKDFGWDGTGIRNSSEAVIETIQNYLWSPPGSWSPKVNGRLLVLYNPAVVVVRARIIRPACFHGGCEVLIWGPKSKRNLGFGLEWSSAFDRFSFNEEVASAFARQDDLEGALIPLLQCGQKEWRRSTIRDEGEKDKREEYCLS